MRVIFLNRYYYPDHSATSQMLSDLAFFMAGARHVGCVVTSCRRYDDPAWVDVPEHHLVDVTGAGITITDLEK